MKRTFLFFLFCLMTSCALGASIGGYVGDAPNVELQVSIDGQTILGERELEKLSLSATEAELRTAFDQNIIRLVRGQSVQLTVEMVERNGTRSNVMANPALFYEAVGKDTLSVSKEGLVTALPESSGSTLGQLLVLYNTPEKSGFNYIYFDIDPGK
ncbi:hypothetical protein [Collimonas sp. PA-H2]|uniref:hypothetical protein n=1 Tax=Collimonas sp. PA-H2 TaxID=1881062 RepID=UPI000BF282C7|nr:hypothetical protein [Collimonas sp. PA-H2]